MKLGKAAALASILALALAASGCKTGCDEYVDEVKAKAKECEVDALKDGPGDLICTDSSKRMASCQAKCVKALSCDAFECVTKLTDADVTACVTALTQPPGEASSYQTYSACVDDCETFKEYCAEHPEDC